MAEQGPQIHILEQVTASVNWYQSTTGEPVYLCELSLTTDAGTNRICVNHRILLDFIKVLQQANIALATAEEHGEQGGRP